MQHVLEEIELQENRMYSCLLNDSIVMTILMEFLEKKMKNEQIIPVKTVMRKVIELR